MTLVIHPPDPRLDLILERIVDVPPELVWAAWTTPEHVKQWFTPAPWKTVECEIDLRPGGIFRTVMRSRRDRSSQTSAVTLTSRGIESSSGPTPLHRATGRPHRQPPR